MFYKQSSPADGEKSANLILTVDRVVSLISIEINLTWNIKEQ